MTFLETKTIKAPVLYSTDNEMSLKYKTVAEDLIKERNILEDNYNKAKARVNVIPKEIEEFKNQLSRTLEEKTRNSLKASIEELDIELNGVREVISLDIKSIMMDKFSNCKVYGLEEAALEEYIRWCEELREYRILVDKAYKETSIEIARIRDLNIYKKAKNDMDNLERYLNRK